MTRRRWQVDEDRARLLRRLRAAGCLVEDYDAVRTQVLEARLLPSTTPNVMPLAKGSAILLPLEISASESLSIRGFALRAPWLVLGGRWAPYNPKTGHFEVLTLAGPRGLPAGQVLTAMMTRTTFYPLQPIPGWLLAEVEDEVAPGGGDLSATLTIEDRAGRKHVFDFTHLRSGTWPGTEEAGSAGP